MAPLRYAAKFDPFLSLDCARVEGGVKIYHLATLQNKANPQSMVTLSTFAIWKFIEFAVAALCSAWSISMSIRENVLGSENTAGGKFKLDPESRVTFGGQILLGHSEFLKFPRLSSS